MVFFPYFVQSLSLPNYLTMDSYVVYCKDILSKDQPLLTIPVADAANFSTKPLKWIRYATSAILGSKGDLKKYDERVEDDASNVAALDLEDATPAQRKLLFIPGEPVKFVDRLGLDHLTLSSQFTTESLTEFRSALVARDGTSVISGVSPMFCEACHLIPHSKGTEYIQAVCRWRMNAGEAEIADINDIRNGIQVDMLVDRFFTLGLLAILPTPNFALAVDEVLPQSTHMNPPFRFTPHYFLEDRHTEADRSFVRHYERDLRYPNDINGWPEDWPPRYLFDFIYGVVIARKYGNNDAMNSLGDLMESNYYPQGIQTATDQALVRLQRDKLKEAERREEQKATQLKGGRMRQHGTGSAGEPVAVGMDASDAFDFVFCMWMRSRFGPDGQEARAKEMEEHEKRELERQHFTAENVEMWRQNVEMSRFQGE